MDYTTDAADPGHLNYNGNQKFSKYIGRYLKERYEIAKQILNQIKMEAAQEVGVDLKQGYNGDLTSRQAGSIGGQMVKKMIQAYEEGNK